MAFWIKWEKGLTRKQEILQIAARLLIAPPHAAGCMMHVMEWLDDNVSEYTQDGHACVTLKSLSVSFVDTIAGVEGYGEAMAEVGWLTAKDGVLTFVNAGRHNGKSAKNRVLAADRKRSERSRESHAPIVTKKRHLSSLLIDRSGGGVGGGIPAARTVIPLLLSTDDFRDAWAEWLQHRREKKDPIDPGSMTERKQLKMLETWGIHRAIAAIGFTIFKGWTGLREPDEKDNYRPPARAQRSIYTEPAGWREIAAKKWPGADLPEKWTDVPADMRNGIIAEIKS